MKFGAFLSLLHLHNRVHDVTPLYSVLKEGSNRATTVYSAKLMDKEHWGSYAQVIYSITTEPTETADDIKSARLIRADLLFPPYIRDEDKRPRYFIPNANLRQLETHLL